MKPARLLLACIALLAVPIPPAVAGDGIPSDVGFKIPFHVSDQAAPARAVVAIDAAGVATMRINYLAGDEIQEVLYTITRKDGPGPQPQPQPNPQPSPNRIAYAYLILETGDLTPQVASVKDAKAWRDAATSHGIKFMVFDKDQGAKAFPNATDKAIKAGLPAIVLLDSSGVATVEKLPATADAMTALINRYGGAK